MNEINLYIPTGVKAENELFNGFGKRELLQSTIGSLFGLSLIHISEPTRP